MEKQLPRFASVRELIESAPPGDWAIPGFNTFNLEFSQAIVEAANAEASPVILMIGEPIVKFVDLGTLIDICELVARSAEVPVAVLLDHGNSPSLLQKSIDRRISIMFDGSELPLAENIERTREWIEKAHPLGLSVEAELGSFGSEFGEEREADRLTSPEDCAKFVSEVDVDMLAVGIGNYHGKYKAEPRIDVARLKEIAAAIEPVPPVLHGTSGIPISTVQSCIEAGVKKVNYGYDLKWAFASSLRASLGKDSDMFQPPAFLGPARDAVVEVARQRIKDVGTSGLAPKMKPIGPG